MLQLKLKTITFVLLCFFLVTFFTGCKEKTSMALEKLDSQQEDKLSPLNKPIPEAVPVISTARLTVTGDIMVHSYQYNEAYNNQTKEYDFSHNFKDMKKYFDNADLVIGNLETVFAGEDREISDYPCFNTPDSFASALKEAGFQLLTTANNHSMDKGEEGLLRTLSILDEYGIDHVGTYSSQQSRDTILIKEVNGIRIAFLSFSYGTNGIPVKTPYTINLLTEELVKSDLQKAKAENPDLIVVLPHMGIEYETYPRDEFKKWTDLMFENGADLILASHPHVLQPMEYKKIIDETGKERIGFVIYSLGNFISSQTTPPRNASILLNIEIQKTDDQRAIIKNVSFNPIWTQFRGTDGKDHFVVRSVYEMLTLSPEEQKALLRPKDIVRLEEIHYETTSMLLGQDIPIEQIQYEYHFDGIDIF